MGNRKNISVDVGSILTFGFGVFAMAALATYHASDPSFLTSGAGAAANLCGRVGAYFSSSLLNLFGMGSFVIPAAFFFSSYILHKDSEDKGLKVLTILSVMTIAVISLTVFLALQWKYLNYGGTALLTGGALGTWISDGLQKQFNSFGSSLVALSIFFVSLAIATPVSIAKLAGRLMWISLYCFGHGLVLMLKNLWRAVLFFVRRSVQVLGAYYEAYQTLKKEKNAKRVMESVAHESQDVSPSKLEEGTPKLLSISPVLSTESAESEDEDSGEEDEDESLAQELILSHQTQTISSSESSQEDDSTQGDLTQSKSEKDQRASASSKSIQILPREVDPALKSPAKSQRASVKMHRGQWKLPTIEFLKKPPLVESAVDKNRLLANSQILKQKFADFGIEGEVTAVRPGPVITLYEFKPGPGVKVSRIASLADDLSMALSAQSVRILAPLPGKSVVGIEIPSDTRETVYLREFLQHPDFYGTKHAIPVVMGKDIGGQTYLSDLARMPHLLCAGQTGSGKSVFMNGLICSLFYRFTPDELRMILVDPKFIEFRAYQDIPHLLLPVVDDPKQASTALKWAVREMERRYRILAKMGARNLASFNQKIEEMGADVVKDLLYSEENEGEVSVPSSMSGSDWIEAFEPDESGAPKVGKLPYIVVIIDELADLMMVAKKEVEISIARIAQKARAAGIHLIIATQRPSTDVITGLIKANLPSRVSFQLASFVDSKTILDRAGAERLLGQGDMLFIPPGVSQTLRLHGAYLDDDEISKVTLFLKSQGKPMYRDEILLADDESDEGSKGGGDEEADDELFQEAVELVRRSGHASASYLQRNLKVGYNRAARMIETMESRGIVGPQDGARPREVLMR